MTITKTNFSDTTQFVGNIVNLYDMINLNSISESDIYVTITVTPSFDIEFSEYNDGDDFSKLETEDDTPLIYGYINASLSALDNIGMSSHRSNGNLLLKLNFVGSYYISFTHDNTFLEFELVTGQKEYRVSLKNQINVSLGNFGVDSDNTTIQLYYDGDDLPTYLHLYEGNNLVNNPSSVFANIEYIKFTLTLNDKQLYTEDTYTITSSGIYKISLQSYSSSSYFIIYEPLNVEVAPLSYALLSIPSTLNYITMSYGSAMPSLYKRFRLQNIATVFTESDFPDKYTVTLVNATYRDIVISQQNIPTAPPATYILKITFPGRSEDPILGILKISTATVKIHSTLEESYTLQSENITLRNMFSVKTLSGFTDDTANIELIAIFTNTLGISSSPSINPFDPTVPGTLAVTATYNGSSIYNRTTRKVYTTIGPTLLDMSISKKYVFSPSEFTTNKKTEVTNDILSNMDIINLASTTDNQSVTQLIYDMIKAHTTITYKPDTTVIRKFSLFYALDTGSGYGTVLESFVTKNSTFSTLTDILRGNSSTSISIRGIRVYPGAFLTMTYLPDNSNNASTAILQSNNTGEVYAIDASPGNANSVTYIALPDTLDLSTSNITSFAIGNANFTDLATLPNGLYTIGLTVKMTTDGDNTGVDHNTYNIKITSPLHPNILIADSFTVEMDIMNHLLDKLPGSGYSIDHLLTEPYFNSDLRNVGTPQLSNYIMGSDYLRLSYKINNVDTQIHSAFVESFDVRPNMTYINELNTINMVASIPFTSASSAFDLYYNNSKLASTNVYKNGLPYMIISAVTSNILTWFTTYSITLQTPSGVTSSDTLKAILDHIYENIDSSPPLVTNYDYIQDIVLDSRHSNTSRAFWRAMINKLATARSDLAIIIGLNKSDYFDSDDMDGIAEYSGIDFTSDEELNQYCTNNPSIYATLLTNEIDTVILRKHLLASMVAIKSNLVPTLSVKYAPLAITVSGTVTNGQLVVSMPDTFVGTSGDVSIRVAVSVITSQGSVYQSNTSTLFTSYIYGKPSNATITYTKKTGGDAVVTGVTGLTTNSSNETVAYTIFSDALGSYTDSVRMVGGNNIALTLNYATSGSVNISSDSNITITGLTRIKKTQSRTTKKTTGSVTTETENISGAAIVTITQQSVTSVD